MIVSISKTETCGLQRAGIQKLWAIPCRAILSLEFDSSKRVSSITVNCTIQDWVLIEFEKDTAYFNQNKKRDDGATPVSQKIQFYESGLSNTIRNKLRSLNREGCIHAIVLDSNGLYHYAGIDTYDRTKEWDSARMRTGGGSAETGKNPAGDNSEFEESIVANCNFYAPQTFAPSIISDCDGCCDPFALKSSEGFLFNSETECYIKFN